MTARLRFSPAPTGYLHVGGARTALFNWLYAKHIGGTFVLRIEDTDADRSKPELVEAIYDSLRWLGVTWDEEYHQSERFDLYREAAGRFLDEGLAYYCDCTQEQVRERVGDKGAGYDGYCRDRGVTLGDGVVVRFRTPDEGTISWVDLIRGRVEFDCATLEDFIIIRSSGVPMFHLANAVDDFDMRITHVCRGEDLVNVTPRVILMMQALGATELPVYAHLPLIVNDQRKKLSKRRDDVAVGDYRSRGYLAEAMRNYLITLGWGPKDDIEIRPIEEFIEQFDLADINKAPAFFDTRKLDHFNGEYIRMLSLDDFIAHSLPYVNAAYGSVDRGLFRRLAPFIQERVRRFDETPRFINWIIATPPEPTEKDWRQVMEKPKVAEVLDLVIDGLETAPWTPEAMSEVILGAGETLETKSQLPVRLALTGQRSGIPLFEPMIELDRSVVLNRLETARKALESAN